MMTSTETRTVRLGHQSSIPGAWWVDPIGWEPANVIEGSEFHDTGWWDDEENTAGIVWFGDHRDVGSDGAFEASIDNLRVASCGNCQVISKVEISEEDDR